MVRVYHIPGWNDELLECILRRLFRVYGRIRPLCFLAYGRTCFLASGRIRLVRQRCWRQRAAMACGRVTHVLHAPLAAHGRPCLHGSHDCPITRCRSLEAIEMLMGVMGSFASWTVAAPEVCPAGAAASAR